MPDVEIDYLEEAGPGITELPQLEGPRPPSASELAAGEVPVYPGWQQDQIETMLKGFGAGVHMMIGHDDDRLWLMTEADLELMAPPAARIANRWEPALKLSPFADPLIFTYGAVLYVWRNALQEAQRRKRLAAASEPEGAAAAYVYADEEPEPQEPGEEAGRTPYFPESPRAARST